MSGSAQNPDYLGSDRGGVVRDTAIAFIVLVVVATIIRTWSRWIQKTRWGRGDVFVSLSLLFILGTYTAILLGVRYGGGRPVVTVSPSDLISFWKVIWLAIPLCYMFAVVWPKLAILDLYLQIFISKSARWASYACALIIVLNAVICASLTIGQCRPIQKIWYRQRDGFCINTTSLFIWTTMANIVTDFIMLLIPIPSILKLQRKWQTKAGILLTFMVGAFGQAISIVRFYQFYYNSVHTSTPDPTYNIVTVFVWTIVEPGAYHLVACFLTYQSLFRWIATQNIWTTGWSRVSLWVSEKSRLGSKSSSVMGRSLDDSPLTQSTTSQHRHSSHPYLNDFELGSGELYAPKRGYVAKCEAQGDVARQGGSQDAQSEVTTGITVRRELEIHSEKV